MVVSNSLQLGIDSRVEVGLIGEVDGEFRRGSRVRTSNCMVLQNIDHDFTTTPRRSILE